MVTARTCKGATDDGRQCGAHPLRDSDFCFWHDPEHASEAQEARRLGGLRRQREKTVEGAYDLAGLESVGAIRRLLEIATLDALSLENSIARSRTLIYAAVAAGKLLEVSELEERVRALEEAVKPRDAWKPKGQRR